jgi:hypothetical protein
MFRWNVASDQTELRIRIGDNPNDGLDKFSVGAISAGDWYEKFTVGMDGRTVMSAPSIASANDLPASSLSFYIKQATSELVFLVKYADGIQTVAGSVTLS